MFQIVCTQAAKDLQTWQWVSGNYPEPEELDQRFIFHDLSGPVNIPMLIDNGIASNTHISFTLLLSLSAPNKPSLSLSSVPRTTLLSRENLVSWLLLDCEGWGRQTTKVRHLLPGVPVRSPNHPKYPHFP
jgi:hypothetical protein